MQQGETVMKVSVKDLTMGLMMALALVPVAGFAHEFKAGGLTINHPWTRAMPKGSDMAAGYLSVTNTGKAADVLEGAEVNGVGHVMLHTIKEQNGVATMDEVDGVTIEPGQTVTLQPGGVHLMWMDVTAPLEVGKMVSGTLEFKHAGKVPVGFKVEPMGVKAPVHAH
jgi:copper(I)-binding protein